MATIGIFFFRHMFSIESVKPRWKILLNSEYSVRETTKTRLLFMPGSKISFIVHGRFSRVSGINYCSIDTNNFCFLSSLLPLSVKRKFHYLHVEYLYFFFVFFQNVLVNNLSMMCKVCQICDMFYL